MLQLTLPRLARSLAGLAFALLALLALPSPSAAAPGDHVFSLGFPSAGSIASTDPSGAFTSAGTFFGVVDFGGGALTDASLYLARFDGSGSGPAHVPSLGPLALLGLVPVLLAAGLRGSRRSELS